MIPKKGKKINVAGMNVKGGAISGATFFSTDSAHERRARIS